jgi:hypothetical protein
MIDHPENSVVHQSEMIDVRFQKETAEEFASVFKKLFDCFIEDVTVDGSI